MIEKERGLIIIVDKSVSTTQLFKLINNENIYIMKYINSYSKASLFLNKELCNLIIICLSQVEQQDFEFIESLKLKYRTSSIPIIVVSSDTRTQIISTCFRKGIYDYITKPINVQAVKNKIELALMNLNK